MEKWSTPWVIRIGLIGAMGAYEPVSAREKPEFTTLLDAIYSQQVEEISYEELYENLWEFYQHPLVLNHASREDLSMLCILTDAQLDHFFDHLEKNGPLRSIDDLQAIPGFDLDTISQLLPFVQVPETYPKPTKALVKPGSPGSQHSYWLGLYERTVEKAKNSKTEEAIQEDTKHSKTENKPKKQAKSSKSKKKPKKQAEDSQTEQKSPDGSPDKIATRFIYRHPQGWDLGILGRKSPGEAFIWDHATARYGMDVWIGYFLLKDKGLLKSLILGDYKIGYGQGLVAKTGFGISKGSDAILSIRTNKGIKPHTSLATYSLRGAAATLQWGSTEMTTYYAYTYLNGNVKNDPEQVIGIALLKRTQSDKAELGLNVLHNHSDEQSDEHSLSDQDNTNISLFYRYLWQKLDFFGEGAISFGEGAISLNGAKAVLFGVRAGLSPQIGAMLLFRHYDPAFYSPHGRAFRENSSNKNEKGLYLGLRLHPLKKLTLNAYYDYFRFPDPTATIPERSAGYKWLTKATYQLGKPTMLLLQCTGTSKARKITKKEMKSLSKDTRPVSQFQLYKCKAQLRYAVGRNIYLSCEAQGSSYRWRKNTTWGYAVRQSVAYKRGQLSITGQVTWSETDYQNRFFFYDRGVLYSKALSDPYCKKGINCSLYVCYKPTPSWQVELRYVFAWHLGEPSTSQDDEKTDGNIKNQIKLQLMYKF